MKKLRDPSPDCDRCRKGFYRPLELGDLFTILENHKNDNVQLAVSSPRGLWPAVRAVLRFGVSMSRCISSYSTDGLYVPASCIEDAFRFFQTVSSFCSPLWQYTSSFVLTFVQRSGTNDKMGC